MKSVFTFFSRKTYLLFALFLLIGFMAEAQLKIGTNPTSIQKSSILELESSRQGLLLPRLTDTAAINILLPPDGMMIYLVPDNSLRIRSNGYWKKIADASAASSNWTITGNTATDSTINFMGTIDGKPLTIRTNNQPRLIVGSNGNVGVGTTTPTAKFEVNGTVKFDTIATNTTEVTVLVLAANGSVLKRNMSSAAFANAIKAINGIQAQTLSLKAAAALTTDTVQVINSSVDSTISINLPVQNGSSASKPYGFLTYGDWQKIHSGIQVLAIGAVGSTSNVNGATITTTDSSRTINLTPADGTNPGLLTAIAQTIGGPKTFLDSVTVNGHLRLGSVPTNSTLDSVLVISNGLVQKRQVNTSAFSGAIRSINGNRDSLQGVAFHNAGIDLSVIAIPKTGAIVADSIILNVPDAGTVARGVVTTTAQTFAGTKHFADSLAAGVSFLVGSAAGSANSTVQVAGSMSMSIITVTTATTLNGTHNTVLGDASGAAFTITLPPPAGIAGRIYTIKKIGTGDIDKALTIAPNGGTIDGGANYIIYNDYTYVTLQTDGTNWFIIKK